MRSNWVLFFAFFFFTSLGYNQSELLGKSIPANSFDNLVPIELNDDYGVFIQTFKFLDVAAFKLIQGSSSEEAFADKFNLIQWDIASDKIKTHNYKVDGGRTFKAYTFNKKNCYILSKNIEHNQLIYYLDVIDLKTFELKVKSKQIVKYTSRQDHKIISFRSTKLGLILLIQKDEIIDGSICLEVFILSEENKVVKLHEIRMAPSQNNLEFSKFYEWDNRCCIVYQKKYSSTTIDDIAVVNFGLDTTYQYTLTLPIDTRLEETIMPDEVSAVSLCYMNNSYYPNAIVNSTFGEDEPNSIEIPLLFISQLKSWSGTVQGNEIFYHFSLFLNDVVLLEAYKVIITDNGDVQKKYGPRILIKFDNEDDLAWSKDLSELEIVSLKFGRNLTAFSTTENFYMLYYSKKGGLTLAKIDAETGQMNSNILSISKSWLKSCIGGIYCDEESNQTVVLLAKGLNSKPLLLTY